MSFRDPPPAPPSLDPMDLKILNLLCVDAKSSFAEMAKKVGLSAPAVHARVKRMEKDGVIRKYTVDVNPASLGLIVTAIVRMQTGANRCREVSREVEKYPEVVECYVVAGEDDLLMKIRTSTPFQVLEVMDRLKQKGLVSRTQTHLVMETSFER